MPHLLSSVGALLTSTAPSVCALGVLFPKKKRSGGHLLLVSWQYSTLLRGYQDLPISPWSEHGPLLPGGNPPNWCADSLRRCYGARRKEGQQSRGRKGMLKGLNEGRDCRKWQCVWSDKPLAKTPTPWGRTGGYKTLASVLRPRWPCNLRPLHIHLVAKSVETIIQYHFQYHSMVSVLNIRKV